MTRKHQDDLPRDLPPEVILMVLFTLHSKFSLTLMETTDPNDKRQLSRLCMTCHHFALKLRPLLFRDLTLSSYDEGRTLLGLIKDSPSEVSSWIRRITLRQREPSLPWSHLIYSRLRNAVPSAVIITHELRCDAASALAYAPRIRSLHPSLPRTPPGLFMRCTHVRLVDVRFRAFGDLAALVGGLPCCTSLHCTRVLWETWSAPHALSRYHSIKDIVVECGHGTDATTLRLYMSLLVATSHGETRGPHGPAHYIYPSDLHAVSNLVHAISCIKDCASPGSHRIRTVGDTHSTAFSLVVTCEESTPCIPELRIDINSIGHICRVSVLHRPHHHQSRTKEGQGGDFMWLTHICKEVERLASSYDSLADVSVEFDTNRETFRELELSLAALQSSTASDQPGLAPRLISVCQGNGCDGFNHLDEGDERVHVPPQMLRCKLTITASDQHLRFSTTTYHEKLSIQLSDLLITYQDRYFASVLWRIVQRFSWPQCTSIQVVYVADHTYEVLIHWQWRRKIMLDRPLVGERPSSVASCIVQRMAVVASSLYEINSSLLRTLSLDIMYRFKSP